MLLELSRQDLQKILMWPGEAFSRQNYRGLSVSIQIIQSLTSKFPTIVIQLQL